MKYDSDVSQIVNTPGETESDVFTHRFAHVVKTYTGLPVNVTYHYVECGDAKAEPIIFFHGLAETWRVWKDHMQPLCSRFHAIAVDSEGMGQSTWTSVLEDLPPNANSREFYADMQMGLIRNHMKIRRFNMVVTDYSFWSTMNMLLSDEVQSNGLIIRYAKFQSTVGVEDPDRVPQAQLMKKIPGAMAFLTNSNPYALPRVLMGQPLEIPVPGFGSILYKTLLKNRRVGPRGISAERFRSVILSGVSPNMFTAWVYFYNKGQLISA